MELSMSNVFSEVKDRIGCGCLFQDGEPAGGGRDDPDGDGQGEGEEAGD